MNAETTQASAVRPLVTAAPAPNDKRLRDALQTLHDRNSELIAVERFILLHQSELSGLRWSVRLDSSYRDKSGVHFYCIHPGETGYEPDAPTPEDIARRFPGEWQIKDGYEGRKDAEAKREGITLTIGGFAPRPGPKPPGAGQVVTF